MFDKDMTQDIVRLSEGNIGAMTFILDCTLINPVKSIKAFEKMDKWNIRGDKLYMLWNDCCNRDYNKTLDIMINNSLEDILEHINYEKGRGIEYE